MILMFYVICTDMNLVNLLVLCTVILMFYVICTDMKRKLICCVNLICVVT
jgi:hypothetical protein